MSFRQGRAVLEGKPWPASQQNPVRQREPAQTASSARFVPAIATFPATAPARAIPARTTAVQAGGRGGAVLVALYFFIFFSRSLDVSAALQTLHVPMVLLTLMMIMALASGKILHVFDTKIARAEVLLVLWICVSFLFSSWHSGGIDTLKWELQSALLFIAVTVLLRDIQGWMYAAWALALSAVASSLLSFGFSRVMQAGRISVASGTLSDPNEYALILLLTAPFWWIVATNGKHPKLMTGVAILFCLPVAAAFFRTGSRGGLTGLATMSCLVFWRARPIQKIVLVGVAALTLVSAFTLLPTYLAERYMTLFSNSDMAQMSGETAEALRADIGSSNARREMLYMSLHRTMEHPIFGVGPGGFEAANWDAELKAGRRVGWQPSHNSYTQVSAELGIPGLILFLSVLWQSVKSLRTVSRQAKLDPALRRISNAASCVSVILITFCVGAFFLSVAYTPMIAAMLGLCAALERIAAREVEMQRRRVPSGVFPLPTARPA